MSSLSNQLSALTSTNKGFAHSTESGTKGIGLGFTHSTKHGHSITAGNVKRRASVLYDNARAAADVPEVVLRENAVEALVTLREATGGPADVDIEKLMDIHSLNFERGTSTAEQNKEVDASIDKLLQFLTTAVAECPPSDEVDDNVLLMASLQIIEYLLRKYEIHARDSNLLTVFLPLISTYPQLITRVLGLLNLQSVNSGMWYFLRPYASAESPPVNRVVLAKGASRNEAVFATIAKMGREAAEIWEGGAVRRGISTVLSFSASILVEALHIQSRKGPDKSGVAGVQENFVRRIFPLIVGACGSKDKCGEWKEWGRLLASTLATLCPLSVDVNGALCDAVVAGIPTGSTKILLDDVTEDDWGNSAVMDEHDLDDAASGIMTLLSILGSNGAKAKDEWKYYLPIYPSKKNSVDYLGCALQSSTYKVLSNRKALFPNIVSGAMGTVYGSLCDDESSDEDKIGSIGPLLGAAVMHMFEKMEKDATRDLRKKGRELGSDGDLLFLLSLIKEPSMSTLWESKQATLVASLAVQTVTSYDNLCKYLNSPECDDQKRSMIVKRYKMVLDSLSELDSAASDRGVAHAIELVTGKSSDESSTSNEDRMSSLALILGHAESFAAAKTKMSRKGKSAASDLAAVDGSAFLLPPRVALEHADATVRVNAIAGLKVMDVSSMESDLSTALLRRLSVDNDPAVVVSAGDVLSKILEYHLDGPESGDIFENVDSLAEGALAALFHWTTIGKDETWSPSYLVDGSVSATPNKSKGTDCAPLLVCLRICGLVGRIILDYIDESNINSTTHLFYVLFLSLTAHVHGIEKKGDFKKVSETASKALSQLGKFGKPPPLQSLFTENETCLSVVQYCYGTDRAKDMKMDAPDLIRRRFLWLALLMLSETVSSSSSSLQAQQVVTTLVLKQMRSYNKESKKSPSFQAEAQQLSNVMGKCLTQIGAHTKDELPYTLLQLTSVSSGISFQSVAKPAIVSFIGSFGDKDYTGLASLINASMHSRAQPQDTCRLLTAAAETFGERTSAEGASELLLSLLSLLSHPDRVVRQKAMTVIEKFRTIDDEMMTIVCNNAIDKQSPTWSSMVMDGVNALPQLLAYIVTSSKSPTQFQDYLITGCLNCALNDDAGFSRYGCHAAAVLLSAMEKAGENTFPLSKRWELAGKDLFQALTEVVEEESWQDELRNCIATMLKGVIVTDAQSDGQIISIGPSKSGRVRSYSIGASDSFRLLEPYPKDMTKAILQALTSISSKSLTDAVIQYVLLRQSWATGVFPKIDSQSKHSILSALLVLRADQDNESAGKVLLNLPLKANDLLHLVKNLDVSASEHDQLSMVFVADVIQGKLDALGKASEASKLSSLLFDNLRALSSTNKMDVGDTGAKEYTRISILQSLVALHSTYKDQLSELSQKRKSNGRKRSRSSSDAGNPDVIASQATLLVGLLGGDNVTTIPLQSARGKALSLSLLTYLCEESPSTVVTALLPALSSLDGHAVGDALSAIVPAFCSHADSAGLSLFDLLDTLVAKMVADVPGNKSLIDQFANALLTLSGDDANESLATFLVCVMALEAFNLQSPTTSGDDDSVHPGNSNSGLLRMPRNTSNVMKVSIALSLLQYAENIMGFICESSAEIKEDKLRIIGYAVIGSGEAKADISYNDCTKLQKRSILYLTISLLQSVQDIISSPSIRKVARKSTGSDADLCLRLWQELMQTHVNSLSFYAKQDRDELDFAEKKFWVAAPVVTNECLDHLQNLLPASHFLASVDSILNDDDVESFIKKKTIRLLTDRVADVNQGTPEHSLFLEMVPDLVTQLNPELSPEEDVSVATRKAIVKQQGALIAIESFVSSLYPNSEKSRVTNAASKVFLPALASVCELLTKTTSSWLKARSSGVESETEDAECQLLSSCALCISSLVANLKARCLHLLPQIVKPLIESLKSINASLRSDDKEQSLINFQLAILRTISIIAEVLPGFLLPHLPLIFSSDALPAASLVDSDHSIVAASKQLEVSLATKTPVRQLIPCLSNALAKTLSQKGNSEGWEEACTILRAMGTALENSTRADLTSVVGKIFNGLVSAYACEGDAESTIQLLQNANKCLLSLVMKLSETQLRPLYARLREWRGDISSRRYAFWSLSAELSKALKSIFFPSLTSVITDLVDELENAVSVLCSKKKGGEAKRRKIDAPETEQDVEEIKSLQPLLLCLESALKADAHEGGEWTRGDDSQRYNIILNHLGKLLIAQVPSNMTVISDLSAQEQKTTSAYERLVQGVGSQEHGNVVGCLTALATAAGNEQLWKPLNFAVLEACGHTRSEVRKAGVSCLLSIIESIGEEYMVLLPECLPILSELLEDADEDIADMARECVRQGEELLGESLEESLR